MRRIGGTFAICLLAGSAQAQIVDCASAALARSPAAASTSPLLAPVAPEMDARPRRLGVGGGVLAEQADESLTVDAVLLRLRVEGCQNVASALPAAAPAALPAGSPAAYAPKTQFDNTPWRFDMSQGGKRMTADEFDAWMKARGVRVAKGAPQPATPADPPAPPPAADKD